VTYTVLGFGWNRELFLTSEKRLAQHTSDTPEGTMLFKHLLFAEKVIISLDFCSNLMSEWSHIVISLDLIPCTIFDFALPQASFPNRISDSKRSFHAFQRFYSLNMNAWVP